MRTAVPGTLDALAEDLAYAASKRLPRMFVDRAGDSETYPTLARVVSAVEPKAWEENPTVGLRMVLFQAVESLPKSKGRQYFSDTLTWYWAGRILYFGSEVDNSLRTYSAYCQQVRKACQPELSPREFGRFTSELRKKLAQSLLEMERDAIQRRESTIRQQVTLVDSGGLYDPERDYVRREELYGEIDSAIATGYRVIGLVGDGGVGKSTLIQRYLREQGRRLYIFADFRTPEDLAASMHDNLVKLGLSTAGLSADTAWLKLRDIMAIPDQHPRFIVLDNIEHSIQLNRLGIVSPEVTIFVTTRNYQVLPEGACKILVGELTEHEATAAIRLKLPDASEYELSVLKNLRGRALAIDICCAFMRNAKPGRRQGFCAELRNGAAEAVNQAASKLGRQTLETLYAQIIKNIESIDRYTARAVRLLELEVAYSIVRGETSFFPFVHPSKALASNFTPTVVHNWEVRSLYFGVRETLVRYHLVRIGNGVGKHFRELNPNDLLSSLDGVDTDIHPLTLETLYGVFRECLADRIRLLLVEATQHAKRRIERADQLLSWKTNERVSRDVVDVLKDFKWMLRMFTSAAETGMRLTKDLYFRELSDLAQEIRVKRELLKNAPCFDQITIYITRQTSDASDGDNEQES